MLTYLTKFSKLPKNIQSKINDPSVMALIDDLSKQYKVNLASTVMKIMVGEIKFDALIAYLINELGLSAEAAKNLDLRLRRGVFADVIDYILGEDSGAKLVFSEADEAEVRKSKQDLTASEFDDAIDGFVEEIVKQSRLNFSEKLTAGKFRQVVKTYLRGSRDKLATMEALTKASELGGVALSKDAAERTLIIANNFIKTESKKVESPPQKIKLPEDIIATVATEAYDLTTSLRDQGKLKNIPARPVAAKSQLLDVDHELMPPPPAVMPIQPIPVPAVPLTDSRQVVKEAIQAKKVDKFKLRKITTPVTPVNNVVAGEGGKVRMDDVRYTAKALSPVEELRSFTLLNFRRLDPDALKAVEKIKSKIELLGNENYAKKIEAVVAWNESPLNRLYVAVCRRSLNENLPLGAVLDRELKKDKDFLKPEELSAIISLNKSLKF
ncbi:hypothetical protein IPN41_03420 [Candidatus Falkowbacteria bacterium]|nr:MAG: hypothetical protein IPN41_03420 [Candidatus Falkowbacteria bacterium]